MDKRRYGKGSVLTHVLPDGSKARVFKLVFVALRQE